MGHRRWGALAFAVGVAGWCAGLGWLAPLTADHAGRLQAAGYGSWYEVAEAATSVRWSAMLVAVLGLLMFTGAAIWVPVFGAIWFVLDCLIALGGGDGWAVASVATAVVVAAGVAGLRRLPRDDSPPKVGGLIRLAYLGAAAFVAPVLVASGPERDADARALSVATVVAAGVLAVVAIACATLTRPATWRRWAVALALAATVVTGQAVFEHPGELIWVGVGAIVALLLGCVALAVPSRRTWTRAVPLFALVIVPFSYAALASGAWWYLGLFSFLGWLPTVAAVGAATAVLLGAVAIPPSDPDADIEEPAALTSGAQAQG